MDTYNSFNELAAANAGKTQSQMVSFNMSPTGTTRSIYALTGSAYKFIAIADGNAVRLAAMDISPDAADQTPFYIQSRLFKNKQEATEFVNKCKTGQPWDTPGKLITVD